MELSEWVIFTGVEALFVLLILCCLLLFHAKGLKTLIIALQKKLAQALRDLKKARSEASEKASDDYKSQIEVQISETESFHAQLEPGCAIEDDISSDTPPNRRVAAIRHHFLCAEKDALGGSTGDTNWEALGERYYRLLDAASSEPVEQQRESASYEEQQTEIERFKRLFTTMEGQWQNAKEQAEKYYAQLLVVIGDSEDPEFTALKSAAEIQIQQFSMPIHSTKSQPSPTAIHPNADVSALKAINSQQKNQIQELQQRLQAANSDAERAALATDLEQQLTKQLRFMKESEVCINLLEQELSDAMQRLNVLEKNKPQAESASKHIEEKMSLINKISALENDNEQLIRLSEHAEIEQRRTLAKKDREIHTLNNKFNEIVKRYQALAGRTHKN